MYYGASRAKTLGDYQLTLGMTRLKKPRQCGTRSERAKISKERGTRDEYEKPDMWGRKRAFGPEADAPRTA